MSYIKSTSYTIVNYDNSKVELINNNLYEITYGIKSNIRGKIVDIDDGESDFSAFEKPYITVDCSTEFSSNRLLVLLDEITYISKHEY